MNSPAGQPPNRSAGVALVASGLAPPFPALGLPIGLILAVWRLVKRQPPQVPLGWAVAGVAGLVTLAGLLGPAGWDDLGVAAGGLLVVVIALVLGAMAGEGDRNGLLDALLIGCLVSAGIAFLLASPETWLTGRPRMTGIMGQENRFGGQMAVGIALLAAGGGRRWHLALRLLALAALVVALLYSGTRTAYLGAGVGVLVAAVVLYWRPGLRRFVLAGTLAFAVLLTLASLDAFGPRLNPVAAASRDRLPLWIAGLDVFREYPLTGVGFGESLRQQFRARLGPPFEPHSAPGQAHNFFVDWLAKGGLLGGLPMIALLLAAVVLGGKRWPQTLAVSLTFLVMDQFDANLDNAYVGPVLWILLGAALARQREGTTLPGVDSR